MRVDEIDWDPDVPEEIRQLLMLYFVRWLCLVPAWCRCMRIAYAHSGFEDGATARTDVSYVYGWAVITFSPIVLAEPDRRREEVTVHELLHISHEPMQREALRAIEKAGLEEGDPLRALLEELVIDGIELTVAPLARSLMDIRNSAARINA